MSYPRFVSGASLVARARWLAAVLATVSLVACGGRPASEEGERVALTEAAAPLAQRGVEAAPPTGPYELVLFNGRAVHQDFDRLDATPGKGYEPLEAFVYVKGRPRSNSPVASVKPVCRTTTSCEYLPPRKSGLADRYVISIDSDAVAQLLPSEDKVVITARQLALTSPATVNVTLAIPGQAPIVKRIVYRPPAG